MWILFFIGVGVVLFGVLAYSVIVVMRDSDPLPKAVPHRSRAPE